jgi:MSHA pilin protein MshA
MRALRCKGVSQVELVVIVTMIGIVAAFAIPRFTHLQNDVRTSEVVALSADLRRAAETAHAQYVKSGATPLAVAVEGKQIRLKNGYPDASIFGIQRAMVNAIDFRAEPAADSVTYSKHDATDAAACGVTYVASPAPERPAAVTNLKTSGC